MHTIYILTITSTCTLHPCCASGPKSLLVKSVKKHWKKRQIWPVACVIPDQTQIRPQIPALNVAPNPEPCSRGGDPVPQPGPAAEFFHRVNIEEFFAFASLPSRDASEANAMNYSSSLCVSPYLSGPAR